MEVKFICLSRTSRIILCLNNAIEKEISCILDDNHYKKVIFQVLIPILSTNILKNDSQDINIFLTTNPRIIQRLNLVKGKKI